MNRFKLVLFAAMLVFALSSAAGAGEGGTLVYSWSSNAGPLNPHMYSPNQMFAQAMVYEPLVRYSDDGRLQPCLAESWEISPDGREYTFHLRKGVVFSDGEPWNAAAARRSSTDATASRPGASKKA